jgi:PIN domain nuclease of toxin-antitoxin system
MLLADRRLGERQRSMIENASQIYVSAVSAFEIATKVRIGKLPEPQAIANSFEQICRDFDYVSLDVTQSHGIRAGQLPGIHRDPFDRLLAAQSIVEGIPLVTSDPVFKSFGVETAW